MVSSKNPREYGLPKPGTPIEPPKLLVEEPCPFPCPHCGGNTVFGITIKVENPAGQTGIFKGHYVGCAACQYASPMIVTRSK